MQGYHELLVGTAFRIPVEARSDIVDGVIEGVEVIQLGKRALHQLGVLTEQFSLVEETIAQRDSQTDIIDSLAVDSGFR